MREKTDLKTLILAAREGKNFRAFFNGFGMEPKEIINPLHHWKADKIAGDWEVEWIPEPLKIETTVLVHRENEHCGKIIMEHELIGKRFKMVLVEIQEADHAE